MRGHEERPRTTSVVSDRIVWDDANCASLRTLASEYGSFSEVMLLFIQHDAERLARRNKTVLFMLARNKLKGIAVIGRVYDNRTKTTCEEVVYCGGFLMDKTPTLFEAATVEEYNRTTMDFQLVGCDNARVQEAKDVLAKIHQTSWNDVIRKESFKNADWRFALLITSLFFERELFVHPLIDKRFLARYRYEDKNIPVYPKKFIVENYVPYTDGVPDQRLGIRNSVESNFEMPNVRNSAVDSDPGSIRMFLFLLVQISQVFFLFLLLVLPFLIVFSLFVTGKFSNFRRREFTIFADSFSMEDVKQKLPVTTAPSPAFADHANHEPEPAVHEFGADGEFYDNDMILW